MKSAQSSQMCILESSKLLDRIANCYQILCVETESWQNKLKKYIIFVIGKRTTFVKLAQAFYGKQVNSVRNYFGHLNSDSLY